ncbi:MAG: hydrogenase iron-sulfur subunit [Dehalococcoidia bacterium]|nr:hydrogenase iron-sulfur subunit [Dehalococcoidia bacterium]
MRDYRPKVICFSCKFSWGYLTDEATLSREIENWIPLICTGKIDATQIMDAFKAGADGVLILGCPEGDCHYQDGNFEARKKVYLLRKLLKSWGIEEKRLRIVLSANPDGRTIPQLLQEMSRDLTKLGPLKKVKMAGAVQEEENVVRRGK